ncbi:MAG: hypothetical protein NC313_03945 [Butyrivibrio sp.]|nr:hypothetical protein [Butyrivibrio sp.]
MDNLKRLFIKKNTEETDIFKLKYKHYGVLNRDKILYYIEENNKDLGFFAMYRYWLEYLYFADICGYLPVVSAGKDFAYKEEGAVNETTNPFEYYFLQPSAISVQETRHSKQVILSDIVHRKMVELIFTGKAGNYKYNKRYLSMMSYIVKKYVHFNKYTEEYINESIKKLNFGQEKMLGIHIRGTDFRAKYNNHPVYVSEEDCFEEVEKMLKKNSYSKIFVATDDKRILSAFIKKYGGYICFYGDVERSSNNKSVAFSDNSRDNHKYLLGLEVIRDMYTLSMCNGLIAGISQVAICAQINKLARNEHYEDIKIIDKGLYKNSHYFAR